MAKCTKLESVHLAHNNLCTLQSIQHLAELPNLSSVDLQHNKLEGDDLLDFFAALPSLRVLYMQGNPCVKATKHYRKMYIARIQGLRYLDDRPVFPDERLRCEAWYDGMQEGGTAAAAAAERAELQRQREEAAAKDEANFKAMEALLSRGAVARQAAAGAYEGAFEGSANIVLPGTGSVDSSDDDDDDDETSAAAAGDSGGAASTAQHTVHSADKTMAQGAGAVLEQKPSPFSNAPAAAPASAHNTQYDYSDPAEKSSGVHVPAHGSNDAAPAYPIAPESPSGGKGGVQSSVPARPPAAPAAGADDAPAAVLPPSAAAQKETGMEDLD